MNTDFCILLYMNLFYTDLKVLNFLYLFENTITNMLALISSEMKHWDFVIIST